MSGFAADGTHVVAVDISVRQHHGRVVLIHDLPGNLTDQSGVGAVGHRQRLGQFIERLAANWAVWVFGGAILLVALAETMSSGQEPQQQKNPEIKQYFVLGLHGIQGSYAEQDGIRLVLTSAFLGENLGIRYVSPCDILPYYCDF